MSRWHPARWPLRTRVALAFLAATAVALTVLGVFVQVRVDDALENRLRDTVTAEADRLEAVPGADRSESVEALGGEVHAQLLTPQGDARASSRLVAAPLLPSGSLPGAETTKTDWRERTVTVLDDDAAAAGHRDPEREKFVLLVRPVDDGFLVVGTSREDADEALATVRNQLLIAGPLALGLAGGLGYLVAGAGLRPIERMRNRAATITARTAGERLPVPAADDELRRLALTLNAMVARLDDGLQRERRFVAEASHDLRTPLALMLTEIELALAQSRTPEELTRALHSVNDEVRRLIALTEDLLDRAGAERVGVLIEARPVDLVALATRVADRFAAGSGDRTICVTGSPTAEIQGDAARLDRALSNLVDNALRHGDGDIKIEIRTGDDGAEIHVTDQGAGWEPGAASPTGHDGLGLTIVQEIARAHGGTLDTQRINDRTHVRLKLASPHDE
jgi:signal transduction histidine kinase